MGRSVWHQAEYGAVIKKQDPKAAEAYHSDCAGGSYNGRDCVDFGALAEAEFP